MSVAIKGSLVPAFGRHETFTPRYTWFKRGYDAAASDPMLFSGDAHLPLGVGKNMAKSIRYWLQAMRIVEELPVDGSRRTRVVPTRFGVAMLDGDTGFDQYLEAPDSWWLLHWMALSPGGMVPVWWTAFHSFGAIRFTTDTLLDHVTAQIAASGWGEPKEKTIRRDILAMLRCFAGAAGSRRADKVDDIIDSPFVGLGLITDESDGWRFAVGPKAGLSPAVAAFACLDYLSRTGHTARSQLIDSLASDQGGPGRAFKLTGRDLGVLLGEAAAEHPDLVEVTQAAGADIFVASGEEPLGVVATKLLHAHYWNLTGSPRPLPSRPYLPWSDETEDALAAALDGTRPRGMRWT